MITTKPWFSGLVTASLCYLFASPTAFGDSLSLAFIQGRSNRDNEAGGAHGNAWLFQRGGACYALTPGHVMKDSGVGRDYRFANLMIVRSGRDAKSAEADRCAVFKDADLAILRVSGVSQTNECGEPFVGVGRIDSLLGVNNTISLATAGEKGQHQNIPIVLRAVAADSAAEFFVEPKGVSGKLTGGMSGGLVFSDNDLVGILLSVPTDDSRANREGARVLRIDRATRLVTRYFEAPSSVAEVDSPSCELSVSVPIGEFNLRGHLGTPNRADESCGAQITGFNVSSTAAENRPENLLGRGGVQGRWRAVSDGEARVDLELCPSKVRSVSQVNIDTTGCAADSNQNATLEVYVRANQESAPVSFGYTRLSVNERLQIKSGDPKLANGLRVKIVTPRRSAICLGMLSVQ